MMKRSIWIMLALGTLLAGCAAPTPAPTRTGVQPLSSPQEQVLNTPTAPAIKTEFTPSDPATVELAAGRPQLVEFYAVW